MKNDYKIIFSTHTISLNAKSIIIDGGSYKNIILIYYGQAQVINKTTS